MKGELVRDAVGIDLGSGSSSVRLAGRHAYGAGDITAVALRRLSIGNGVTREELVERTTHLSFYVGCRHASSAVARAKELFATPTIGARHTHISHCTMVRPFSLGARAPLLHSG